MKTKNKPYKHPYATAIFPRLDGYDALQFVGLLEYITRAVWLSHGEEMQQVLEDDPRMYTCYAPPAADVLQREIQWTHEFSLQPPLDEDDLPF